MFVPRLASLAQILAFAANAADRLADAYDLVGQIIADEESVFCLRTTNGGVRINVRSDQHDRCRRGDVIRVRGRWNLPADSLEIVGHRPLPAPIKTTAARISTGETDYSVVRLDGVVSAVTKDELDSKWTWFVLKTPTGSLNVSVRTNDYALVQIRSLLDADVSLRGIAIPFSSWRRPLGSHLLLNGQDSISVVRPAAADPFSATTLDETPSANAHRQAVSGIVVATTCSRFFMEDGNGRFVQIRTADGSMPLPSPGHVVTAVGFPEMDPFKMQLTDAVFRYETTKPAKLPTPGDTDPASLFATPLDTQAINTDYHGKTIRLRGRIVRLNNDDAAPETLALDCSGRQITVDLSGVADVSSKDLRHETILEIGGVCLAEFEQAASAATFPRFKGFTLVPRTVADLRILENPPWWTPFRLFCVIAALLVVIIAILIWNRAINVLANRRGHELYREQMKHARAELKVEERTRLAVELHDSLSQTLTGVSLQIDAAVRKGGERLGPTLRFLEIARQMLASCRHELRCCLWDLRSRTFEEKDLTEAVLKTVAPHSREADISVRFNVPRNLLSESTTHAILRIARELTVNAIRHGQATQVKIAGEYENGSIRFSVRDNGNGFTPEDIPGAEQGHYGLLGIRERLAQHAGTVIIQSSPGHGAKITVTLKTDTVNDHET